MAVITETELAFGDIPIIPGYDTLLPPVENSQCTRMAMFIKKTLHAEPLPAVADLPAVIARVGRAVIIGIYRQFALPGKGTTLRGLPFEHDQLEALEGLVREASDQHKEIFILGDLNLDLSRKEDNTYYRRPFLQRWCDFLEEHGIEWAYTGHTFKSDGIFNGNHRTATLDHIYYRSSADVDATVLSNSASDHSPVTAMATLPLHRTATATASKRQTRIERNLRNMDKDLLGIFLLGWDWGPLLSTTDVNAAVAHLNRATTAALDVAAPVRVYTTPNANVRLKKDTRAIMRERDKAKEKGQLRYKALRNRALSLVRRDHVHHNLQRIQKGGQSAAWRIVAEASAKEKGNTLPIPAGCSGAEEAANLCNNYYIEKVAKLRQNMPSRPAGSTAGNGSQCNSNFGFRPVGVAHVRRALAKLEAKTAVGIDGIPITVYKAAEAALALPLVHIINLIITTSTWPDEWKIATVVPILKAGKPRAEVSSYRPVALLCAASKIAERVLYDQLVAYIEANDLLPKEQHGFRAGRSVDTALASALTSAAVAIDGGRKVAITAYDFSSAFDTLDPAVLIAKLKWLDKDAKRLLTSYMTGGKQRVKWNGAFSRMLDVHFGVRQGSVLGPLLFILLTSDLPASVIRGTDPHDLNVTLFADDTSTIIAAPSWEEVATATASASTNLEMYSTENGLYLNETKTQALKLMQRDASSAADLTLLGVTIDRHLRFGTHHSNVLSDIRRRIGIIRRLGTSISRGPLLTEVAKALIVGRLQSCAWVTRCIRTNEGDAVTGDDARAQIAMNDLARVLLGTRRADKIRVSDLADRAGLPTLNEIGVRQAALAAWKAEQDPRGPLANILISPDDRTRSAAEGQRRPASTRSIAATNMCTAWNKDANLRAASTMGEARRAAMNLAKECRFL